MSILKFFEHFQLIFDNSNVNKRQTKNGYHSFYWIYLFIYNLQNYQIFLPYHSKRNHYGIKSCSYQPQKPAFLQYTSKTFSNVLFSTFSQTFFELIFATKIKTMLLKQPAVKKYCVCYVSKHLKYCTQTNEFWLNKNVCLNIV